MDSKDALYYPGGCSVLDGSTQANTKPFQQRIDTCAAEEIETKEKQDMVVGGGASSY
jgi:hypothetical protein